MLRVQCSDMHGESRRCEWDLPRMKEFCESSTVHLFGFVVRDVIVECHVGSDVVEDQKRRAVNVLSDFFLGILRSYVYLNNNF